MSKGGPVGSGPGTAGLVRQVRTGLTWSALNIGITRMISLLSGIVLARILSPQDFGVFTTALVACQLLMSLNDVGLIVALVRHQGDPRDLARTALTVTLATSTVLYAALFVLAGPFATALHAPAALGVIRLLALVVLIDGVSAVSNGLLTRALRQDLRARCELAGVALSVAVSVLLATQGVGVWSLAWGRVIGNAVSAALMIWAFPFGGWPRFNRAEARGLLTFAAPLAGASLTTFTLLNLDYLIVGAQLGPAALGFYTLAFNLSSWPVNLFSQIVQRVSVAGFSRLVSDPNRLRAGFANAFMLMAAVTVPSCLMLSMLAQPLIHILYGSRWEPSVRVLQVLALLAVVRVTGYLIEDLLSATGHSATVLALQVPWLVMLAPALFIGAHLDGLRGVAIAQAGVALLMLPLFLAAATRAGIRVSDLALRLPWPLSAACLSGLISLMILPHVSGDLLRLLLVGAAAGIVYLAFMSFSPRVRALLRPREISLG